MSVFAKVQKEVAHGGSVPRGWRMAWYEPRRRVGVYALPPLHWILRVLREVHYRVRIAISAPGIERAQVFELQRVHQDQERLAEEYSRGYMAGWRECFQTCLQAVEDEIRAPTTYGEWAPR
jgi:hypothetical protein